MLGKKVKDETVLLAAFITGNVIFRVSVFPYNNSATNRRLDFNNLVAYLQAAVNPWAKVVLSVSDDPYTLAMADSNWFVIANTTGGDVNVALSGLTSIGKEINLVNIGNANFIVFPAVQVPNPVGAGNVDLKIGTGQTAQVKYDGAAWRLIIPPNIQLT